MWKACRRPRSPVANVMLPAASTSTCRRAASAGLHAFRKWCEVACCSYTDDTIS